MHAFDSRVSSQSRNASQTASRSCRRDAGPICVSPRAPRIRSANRSARCEASPSPVSEIIGVAGSATSTTFNRPHRRFKIGIDPAPFDSNTTITPLKPKWEQSHAVRPCRLFDLPEPGRPMSITPPHRREATRRAGVPSAPYPNRGPSASRNATGTGVARLRRACSPTGGRHRAASVADGRGSVERWYAYACTRRFKFALWSSPAPRVL